MCLAVSHDGQWVVSGSEDGQVRFRDAKTWIVQLVLQSLGASGGPVIPI